MANIDLTRYKRMVQYFWDPEPSNSEDPRSPIWCLGKQYVLPSKPPSPPLNSNSPPDDTSELSKTTKSATGAATPPDSASSCDEHSLDHITPDADGGWPTSFLDDFESRIWLTYRSNFPAIAKSQDPSAGSAMSLTVRLRSQLVDQAGFTSDTGWGCMIRSGQSLLANALVMLELGRDWRRGISSDEERRLLAQFSDDPKAPFSIHNFVKHGAIACGKHPGQWFGPSATAMCIQALSNNSPISNLRVYITGDGSDVYEDRFMNIAKPDGNEFHPTLVLVGTRLGIDKVTPVYWEALKASLQMPQSVGIAGGRPSSSHYFIGVQGSYFFYLDPHHTRPALPYYDEPSRYTEAEVDTCHTRRLRRLHIKEMDPSMLIAFLIRDEEDWKSWRQAVNFVQGKTIIHIADKEPALHGAGAERAGALDEVEAFDDDDDDDETVLNT